MVQANRQRRQQTAQSKRQKNETKPARKLLCSPSKYTNQREIPSPSPLLNAILTFVIRRVKALSFNTTTQIPWPRIIDQHHSSSNSTHTLSPSAINASTYITTPVTTTRMFGFLPSPPLHHEEEEEEEEERRRRRKEEEEDENWKTAPTKQQNNNKAFHVTKRLGRDRSGSISYSGRVNFSSKPMGMVESIDLGARIAWKNVRCTKREIFSEAV